MWHDYVTNEPERASDFYSAVIGWSVRKDDPDNWLWVNGSDPVGNLLRAKEWPSNARAYWKPTIAVSDIAETVRQAIALKGSVLTQPGSIANGQYATIADPKGPPFNVFQATLPGGLRDMSRPGEFSWNEYDTTDGPAALAFYDKLFGWVPRNETAVGDSGKYITLARNEVAVDPQDVPVAGLHYDPKLGGTGWLAFVQVTNLDTAVQAAKSKGGSVVTPPMAVPDGRLAVLKDPQDAVFGLHESSENSKGK